MDLLVVKAGLKKLFCCRQCSHGIIPAHSKRTELVHCKLFVCTSVFTTLEASSRWLFEQEES